MNKKSIKNDVEYDHLGSRIAYLITLIVQMEKPLREGVGMMSQGFDLTRAGYHILTALNPRYVDGQPRTVPSIASVRGQTRQAAQAAIDQLRRRRLVAARTNPHHKRSKIYYLTAKGEKISNAMLDRHITRTNNWGKHYNAKELDTAIAVFERLIGTHSLALPEKDKEGWE